MNTVRKLLTASAVTIAALGIAGGAHARCSSGEIANVLGSITGRCDLAQQADQAHAAMGRPLDHMANQAAGAASNYVVPGSGMYVTQGLEAYDQYRRGGFNRYAAPPAPSYAPPMMPYYQPAPVQYYPQPQPFYGAVPGRWR